MTIHIPAKWRDLVALTGAFIVVVIAMQLIAPLLDQLTFLHEEVRKYATGVGFAGFAPVRAALRSALVGGNSTAPRGSAPFISGTIAGVSLAGVVQCTSLLGGVTALAVVNAAAPGAGTGEVEKAIRIGATYFTTPLLGLATAGTGYYLRMRLGGLAWPALGGMSGVYLFSTILLSVLFDRATLIAGLASQPIGFALGYAVNPLLVLLCGCFGGAIARTLPKAHLPVRR